MNSVLFSVLFLVVFMFLFSSESGSAWFCFGCDFDSESGSLFAAVLIFCLSPFWVLNLVPFACVCFSFGSSFGFLFAFLLVLCLILC